VLRDDDFELALYLCYEVHYRGLADSDWEWDPGLLRFRSELEHAFVDQLRDEVGPIAPHYPHTVTPTLDELITLSTDHSLATYLSAFGTLEELREFCVHRSAYQLKEADPHTFGIPRLTGEAKAAMAQIQYDEYGAGNAALMHSTLFGDTMIALGLDAAHGSYIEILPGVTLATVNLVSMFALHRRWRAALVGHLAVCEITSAEPMAKYAQAMRRLGVGPSGRRFFDVHADVDDHHATIARDRMVNGLIDTEPLLSSDLLFGAAAVLLLEQRFGSHLLDAWSNSRSSLVPWEMGTNLT
jgi:hypothetical protein